MSKRDKKTKQNSNPFEGEKNSHLCCTSTSHEYAQKKMADQVKRKVNFTKLFAQITYVKNV